MHNKVLAIDNKKVEVFDYAMYGVRSTGLAADCPVRKPSQKQHRGCQYVHNLPPEDEFDHKKLSDLEVNEAEEGYEGTKKNDNLHPYRCQLEEDVQRLQKRLQEEIDLHATLENAIGHAAGALSSLPCDLPIGAQELLVSVAMLEVTIAKLEEEMVSLHFQLSQERNERRLVEYRLKQSPSPSSSEELKDLTLPSFHLPLEHPLGQSLVDRSPFVSCLSDDGLSLQHTSCLASHCESTISQSNISAMEEKTGKLRRERKRFLWDNLNRSLVQPPTEAFNEGTFTEDLWRHPNQLSEEMVRCMKDIFIHLADPVMVSSKFLPTARIHSPTSPLGHIAASSLSSFSESSSILSFMRSPPVDFQSKEEFTGTENAFDPYSTRGKLRLADIGKYSSAIEVSWMSVGKQQLEYAAEALRKFRLLVEQLAKVNPSYMDHNQKLAFWINVYNAMMMHAYLAYGVPRSELKLFSLMQKAAYTVGGHSFNAAAIEYVILKMKPPAHRPQLALLLTLHKFKISEEQSKYSVEHSELLVSFALSCGAYSSPAVRVFTAEKVNEELQDALRDYIRAYVDIGRKGKLLVPKLVHCFTKGKIEDNELAEYICQFLTPSQAAVVQDCILQRRYRFLSSRNCSLIPFDTRFRYLFLPESRS